MDALSLSSSFLKVDWIREGEEGLIVAVVLNTPDSPIVDLIVVRLQLAPSHTNTLVLKPYK